MGKKGIRQKTNKDKHKQTQTNKHKLPQQLWIEKPGRGRLGSKDRHCRPLEASQLRPGKTSPATSWSTLNRREYNQGSIYKAQHVNQRKLPLQIATKNRYKFL